MHKHVCTQKKKHAGKSKSRNEFTASADKTKHCSAMHPLLTHPACILKLGELQDGDVEPKRPEIIHHLRGERAATLLVLERRQCGFRKGRDRRNETCKHLTRAHGNLQAPTQNTHCCV